MVLDPSRVEMDGMNASVRCSMMSRITLDHELLDYSVSTVARYLSP